MTGSWWYPAQGSPSCSSWVAGSSTIQDVRGARQGGIMSAEHERGDGAQQQRVVAGVVWDLGALEAGHASQRWLTPSAQQPEEKAPQNEEGAPARSVSPRSRRRRFHHRYLVPFRAGRPPEVPAASSWTRPSRP